MRKPLLFIFVVYSSIIFAQTTSATLVQLSEARLSYDVPTIDVPGTINSLNNVELTSGIDARLIWVAEAGASVQSGDILAKLDPIPLQLQKAELEAQLKRIQIQVSYFANEHLRLKNLQQSQSISLFQLDKAHLDHQLALSDANIISSRIALINDQLSRTQVKAPFAGIVAERLREIGSDITANTPLLRLQDIYQLEVRAYVPLQYLRFVRVGDVLKVSNQFRQNDVTVSALIPAADTQSQRAELRLKLGKESLNWLAGELVNVKVATRSNGAAVTVHRDALIMRSEGIYVVTVDENNTVHRKMVKVSDGNGDWVTIEEGLQAGEKVVIHGAERLSDGQKVSQA